MRRRLNVRLFGLIVIGLALASVFVYFLHDWQLKQNAYRLLQRGDKAVRDEDYVKAESYYYQYLNFKPGDADTTQKYANVLDRIAVSGGDRVRLIMLMEKVLRVKPSERELRVRLIHNLISVDRTTDAIEHIKKLLPGGADRPELLHMLGWAQDAQKDYADAATSFREAVTLDPKRIDSWRLLTEELQDRLNQPDEALTAMNEMVAANADSYRAHLLRSQFHRRRGETKEAETDLLAAQKLDANQPDVILESAESAKTQGNLTQAISLLEDGRKRHPKNPEFYMGLAYIKISLEKRAEAIADLEEGLQHAPKSSDLALLLIDLLIDTGQYAQAEAKIRNLLDTGVPPTLPNYLTARLRVADQRWGEAVKLLEGVRQDLGTRSEYLARVDVLLGLCYRQTGDREQELLAYRRAVNEEPGWMIANLGLATALLSDGRVDEVVTLLAPLRSGSGLPADYWLLLARAQLQHQARSPDPNFPWHRIDDALAQAEQAAPGNINVPILRAEMLEAKKDYTSAVALLEKLKTDHPHEIAAWCALADLAARQGQWDKAEAILQDAAVQHEFAGRIEWRLAEMRLWSRRGRAADIAKLARLTDTLAEVSTEDRTRLRRQLADTWYRLGKTSQAEGLWLAIAHEHPRDLRSRAWLLDLALAKNKTEAARQWLAELRKIEGESGGLWRYGAAAILVHEAHGQRKKLNEARRILDDLALHHQDWPRVSVLLATICELQGQDQEAIRAYARAVALGEVQPNVMARLLQLLIERREFARAETELAKYEERLPLTTELARLGAEVALGMHDKDYAKIALKRAVAAVTLPAPDYRDYVWLARFYQATGDNARAEKLLRDAIDRADYAPDTWLALVNHLVQTKQASRVDAELTRLRKLMPTDRQPLVIARVYDAMHRTDLAGRAFRDALTPAPDDFTVLAYAADFFRRADRTDEARALYERLLAPETASPADFTIKARRQLAFLLASRGDSAACKQALGLIDANTQAFGDTPADERVRLFIHSQDQRQSASALSDFQESLQRQPPTLEERLMLAQMYEKRGILHRACSQLADIVEQAPSAPYYLVRYAQLLIKTGALEDAQTIVDRLEMLEPTSPRLLDVKSALAIARKKAAEQNAS